MKLDKVLVLLIDYNTSDLVPDVLKSIQEEEVEITVLIVDNGSSKESFQKLKSLQDPRVHLVRLEKNLGFAGGNNFGVQYAIKNFNDFNYIFLLNTDAYLNPNLIGGLKKMLDAHRDAACISPKIFARGGEIWYSGGYFDFKRGRVLSLLNKEKEMPQPVYEVDVFNGCAVLFRLDKFLEAGMLNEKLFMYYEEADCSLKLRDLGQKILYAPGFTVLHDISYATRNVSHIKTYYLTRNKFFTFNKTMSLMAKTYFLLHEIGHFIKRKKYNNAVYLLKGFVDYKRGKTGQIGTSA